MAKIQLVCPSCNRKLETDRDNAGRDGLCPSCEHIFEIPESSSSASVPVVGRSAGSREYEYDNPSALAGAMGAGICLLALTASAFLNWAAAEGPVSNFLAGQRAAIGMVSFVCFLMVLVSFLGRKSLVPAVFVSGAWGVAAFMWAMGIKMSVAKAAAAGSEGVDVRMVGGSIYLTVVAALLLLAAAVYVLLQVRRGTFRRPGLHFGGLLLLAVICSSILVWTHVKPTLQSHVGRTQALEDNGQDEGPPKAPWEM
jgi:hypothetical protein